MRSIVKPLGSKTKEEVPEVLIRHWYFTLAREKYQAALKTTPMWGSMLGGEQMNLRGITY